MNKNPIMVFSPEFPVEAASFWRDTHTHTSLANAVFVLAFGWMSGDVGHVRKSRSPDDQNCWNTLHDPEPCTTTT